jgi:hypothetical protein
MWLAWILILSAALTVLVATAIAAPREREAS